mgnify:CR=1 FL=1
MSKKTTNFHDKLRPFVFHGVDITNDPKESTGDCPLCDKEGHFYVSTKTGQFHCKSCEVTGNGISFLSKFHAYAVKATDVEDLEELSQDRNISVDVLREWGVAKNPLTGEFLIPAFNAKGKLSNLFKAYKTKEGWKVISTPTMKLHPFGVDLHLANKRNKTVWVVEGPWDAMKLWETLTTYRRNGNRFVRVADRKLSLADTESVLAVPGSGTFNVEWTEYLADKTVKIFFDNDHPRKTPQDKTIKPGWDGMNRVVKLMEESGKDFTDVYRVRWGKAGYDPKLPSGYDLRDILNDRKAGLKKAQSLLKKISLDYSSPKETEGQVEELEPLPVNSFKQLTDEYETANFHLTDHFKDALAVTLACVTSTELGGDQVWLRLIGPPGSGKSTIAEAISAARDYVFPISNITGLHSGFVGTKSKRDTSLIPRMQRKSMIIKDADTLLTAPTRDKILSELRDLYDGTSRATYRTGLSKTYEGIKTTVILCGTDDLRRLNRSSLGERFLDVEILGDSDRSPYLDRAMDNTFNMVIGSLQPTADKALVMEHIKRATMGFIFHLKNALTEGKIQSPTITNQTKEQIKALGQLISFMRAKSTTNDEGGLTTVRGRVELGTRPVAQLTKLAVCVAIVLGKPSIDRQVIRVVKKVALDTVEGYQWEITRELFRFKTGGLNAKQIEMKLKTSEGSARNILRTMREFDIIERMKEPNKSGQRGRHLHVYRLTNSMRSIVKMAIQGKKE